jgi:hypothetical protein
MFSFLGTDFFKNFIIPFVSIVVVVETIIHTQENHKENSDRYSKEYRYKITSELLEKFRERYNYEFEGLDGLEETSWYYNHFYCMAIKELNKCLSIKGGAGRYQFRFILSPLYDDLLLLKRILKLLINENSYNDIAYFALLDDLSRYSNLIHEIEFIDKEIVEDEPEESTLRNLNENIKFIKDNGSILLQKYYSYNN